MNCDFQKGKKIVKKTHTKNVEKEKKIQNFSFENFF